MSGASIETTLELWASSLRDAKQRIRPLFTQERVAASAGLFLDGLLGPARRKTGWMRAEAAGDPGRSGEDTSELQSRQYVVCRLLLEKKNHTLYLSSRQSFFCH